MKTFISSSNKDNIRRFWDKPLLEFIYKKLKCKLIYMGLPSPNAEDIIEWLEYLDKVIAFQCRDYPKPSDPTQSKEEVLKLEETLIKFERQGHLTTSVVYDGYLEEVILNGRDNSNNEFNQDETVMIYNLDFCNQITSPIAYIDKNGESKKAYKFQVIKEILEFQKRIEYSSQKFIMFLTIQASFDDNELRAFIKTPSNRSLENLIKKYSNISGINKKIRILRAFIIETLRNYYQIYNYIPLFIPTIHYSGTNGINMMHFTIVGTSAEPLVNGSAPWYQKTGIICDQKFISIEKKEFVKKGLEGLQEHECCLNPIDSFRNSKVYKEHWN